MRASLRRWSWTAGPLTTVAVRGGCWILVEPELHFGRNVLVPDLAGWRRERMPEIPRDHIFRVPADWVCEVVSPRTVRLDRSRKMPLYAAGEVAHCWIVDPEQKTLEVFRRESAAWVLVRV